MPQLTLAFKGMALKVIPLTGETTCIGRAPDCDIHIDSLAVQPRHAEVVQRDTGHILRDLGTEEGTFLNRRRIEGECPLKPGDLIGVGKHTLTYETQQEPAQPPEEEPVEAEADEREEEHPLLRPAMREKKAWLQILNGQNLGKTISLNRQMTNLGKPGLQMAVIAHRNDGYFVAHLEGEHPTRVGGESIGDSSHLLQDGDIIQIGNIKVQFYLQ